MSTETKIKEIKVYETKDGTQFYNEQTAIIWNHILDYIDEIPKEILEIIAKVGNETPKKLTESQSADVVKNFKEKLHKEGLDSIIPIIRNVLQIATQKLNNIREE